MAYMSQEKKKELWPTIKKVLDKYGVKGSLSVHHHSSLNLNLRSGPIDFIADWTGEDKSNWHYQVNTYHYQNHYKGKALEFLKEVVPLMYVGNHDRSDMMTDYCDVGWWVHVNIGQWDKPYQVIK